MEEERIGLFLDFENLAIGAREQLGGVFAFEPIADALAERGRVVVRRAYADWSMFDDASRELTRHHVELIEIPQRMGATRKNAADIKLAVDAIQLCYERDFVTTFVIGTGDSDFTPLVHKLRELNKRVIGLGIEASTSALLPPACDEFLFYERLQGVDLPSRRPRTGRTRQPRPAGEATASPRNGGDLDALSRLVTQTLSGLKRRSTDVVLASSLKRTLLRKDPTFDEANYGFRSWSELLNNLAEREVVRLVQGSAARDPEVDFPHGTARDEAPFELLRDVIAEVGPRPLTGLKNQLRKRQSDFSEKKYGYGGFLQFVKAAQAAGFVDLERDADGGDHVVLPSNGAASVPALEDQASPADVPPAKTTRRRTSKGAAPKPPAKTRAGRSRKTATKASKPPETAPSD
jgi:uncharacterized LabA/DUF88 family protein